MVLKTHEDDYLTKSLDVSDVETKAKDLKQAAHESYKMMNYHN